MPLISTNRLKKTLCISLSAFFIIMLAGSSVAFAHTLEIGGAIGAVLHIDPSDSPVAGEQARLFFDFKDKEGRLKLGDCNCTISIMSPNGNPYLADISSTSPQGITESDTSLSIPYVFPKKDIYSIKLAGKPKDGESFDEFELSYDVRVDQESSGTNKTATSTGAFASLNQKLGGHLLHFVIFVPAILIAIVLTIYDRTRKKGVVQDIKNT